MFPCQFLHQAVQHIQICHSLQDLQLQMKIIRSLQYDFLLLALISVDQREKGLQIIAYQNFLLCVAF